MLPSFRDLRYVRRTVGDLASASRFAEDIFGLMPEDRTETEALFRSDSRFYSLCLSTELPPAIGVAVDAEDDLRAFADRFSEAGHYVSWIDGDAAVRRLVKRGIAIAAPDGVHLEIVWRHMESGWPYHGCRDTGLSGFSAVQLASTDIEADSAFWCDIAGFDVSDYAGEARFLTLGHQHHHIALYPSTKDGLLGAMWQVESVDHVMRNWHALLDRQVPVVHGPGRQPTSDAIFVTARTPDDFLMTYATQMGAPDDGGPRQFADEARSHCAWGSPSDQPEFKGLEFNGEAA